MSAPVGIPVGGTADRTSKQSPIELGRGTPLITTITEMFQVPEGESYQITAIRVYAVTTVALGTARIYHDPGGVGSAITQVVWGNTLAIPGGTSVQDDIQLYMDPFDKLWIYSSQADTNFFIYGIEART